jgi:hypothetical protein
MPMKKAVMPPLTGEFARRVYAYHEEPVCHLKLPTEVVEYYRGFPSRGVEDDLLALVRHDGILTPLAIYTNGDIGYLGDGHHRLAVAQRLGITEMPIQVIPDKMRWYPPLGARNLEHVLYSWAAHHPWHSGHHQECTAIRKAYLMRCDCGAYWKEEK